MTDLGKRTMERFDLNVAASVLLKDETNLHPPRSIELRTRNICAGGAFLLTDAPFPVGTKVDIGIHLAFMIGDKDNERHSDIHLNGCIIRTDLTGMAVGFDKKYLISPVSVSHGA